MPRYVLHDVDVIEVKEESGIVTTGLADLTRIDVFDAKYVRPRGFFLDFKLFLLSFWISFGGKW